MFKLEIGQAAAQGGGGINWLTLIVALISLAGVALTAWLSFQGIRSRITMEREARDETRRALGDALLTEAAVRILHLRWLAEMVRPATPSMHRFHLEQLLEILKDNLCDKESFKAFDELREFASRAWPKLPDVSPDQMRRLAEVLASIDASVENAVRLKNCVESHLRNITKNRKASAAHPCDEEFNDFRENVCELGIGVMEIADSLTANYEKHGYKLNSIAVVKLRDLPDDPPLENRPSQQTVSASS